MEDNHISPYSFNIVKVNRQKLKNHKSFVLWYTGLSGSGKSTIANKVEEKLIARRLHTYILDGDNMRLGLTKDLGFRDADRKENIRRIGEVAKLFVDAGIIVEATFISPFMSDRQMVRNLLDKHEFVEIHVSTPLDVCEQRDPKKLYQKARAGQIKQFTGIDSAYELPINPEIKLPTANQSVDACADVVIDWLIAHDYIR
jgi:adenylylsulfate kinase